MNYVHYGDCREGMRAFAGLGLRAQMCVTSPPYFGLRSYDEDACCIDPSMTPEQKQWLLGELAARGIHARR